jgi:DNA-binding Lrp family transcriptional regulator
MLELDAMDQGLLNALQTDFPLVSHPFSRLGLPLGLGELEVIERLDSLRRRRILRQISAIFDSRALGYRSVLVAAQCPPGRIEACAAVVNAHPGVSHNYQREHALDLWFTLAVPGDRDLAGAAALLAAEAGLLQYHLLPALRTFRIGVAFDLKRGRARAQSTPPPSAATAPPLDNLDRAVVRALQEDLALVPQPFLLLAQRLRWTEDGLFGWLRSAQERGWLRRYAGVLRHREAGFGEGGMGVWNVPDDRIQELGPAFAAETAVTHCYQRPRFGGWPYNLFTMVHGQDRGDCLAVLDGMALRLDGWTARDTLFSTREFKKERVKYFLEGEPAWAEPLAGA